MATYESIFENAVGGAVALIQHLNKDELQQLLNDDSKLDDLVKDLPQVRYSFFVILILSDSFDIGSLVNIKPDTSPYKCQFEGNLIVRIND